jgi:peptidoglycan glycosyltransferase
VNRQISQLFGVAAILFALLVAYTSRWTVFEAKSLEREPANRRALIKEQRIPRGLILARDGRTRLAANTAHGRGKTKTYSRTYPTNNVFSHSVGYSFISAGRSGLEKSRNDDLVGREDEFATIFSQLESRKREGNDVVTTLDPNAQRTALQALGGRPGSVVALEPSTGAVRVMASVPDFDPNQVPDRSRALNRAPGSPLINRATQGRYAPGSTMKVVTAAAALDSGKFNPNSVLDGSSPKVIGGVPLSNFGGTSYGPTNLTNALTHSINTVWAQVGEKLGKQRMADYMARFGFNRKPPLDYPPEQMDASGVFDNGRLLQPTQAVDIGRVAIGQERLLVTPLQMAMVAAAVGNDGKLMRPHMTDRVVRKDGRIKQRIEPDLFSRVMSKDASDKLGQMMTNVVKEGSGTAAALSGIDVAGKTGTAEVGPNREFTQPWFIAFAPVNSPKVAIAVTVEKTHGQGGTVAAPIAKQVMQVLLGKQAGG